MHNACMHITHRETEGEREHECVCMYVCMYVCEQSAANPLE